MRRQAPPMLRTTERPALPEGNAGRPTRWLPGVGEFTSPFFFLQPPPKLKRLRFGFGSSGFHPRVACGHPVHQRERCKSAESRINLLRGTSRRYCDADGTRDWSRLSTPKRISSRPGDDKIGRQMRARKSRFSYPQACTFPTFPQRRPARPTWRLTPSVPW